MFENRPGKNRKNFHVRGYKHELALRFETRGIGDRCSVASRANEVETCLITIYRSKLIKNIKPNASPIGSFFRQVVLCILFLHSAVLSYSSVLSQLHGHK